MNPGRPASLPRSLPNWKLVIPAVLLAGTIALPGANVSAAPSAVEHHAVFAAQNVDYISASSGAALDLGFPVLVPSWVPAPFGGEPAIDASGGYYSLYWMNGGGEPTFLQVSGVVGGGLPAGSPYDLNIELSINASVNGYDAIHDVTPIYDTVWWIQGGVLYTVTSRNMTGTDSLSLANSLISFVAPVAEEPEPEPTNPPVQEPEPTEPAVTIPDTTNSNSDSGTDNGGTGEGSNDTSQDGSGASQESSTADDTTQSTGANDGPTSTTEVTPQSTGSDGTGEPIQNSDGTGGPPVEVVPSDGTGGAGDVVVIPRVIPNLTPTP